jgi:hypothetical protein
MTLILCLIWACILPERLIFPAILTLVWFWWRTNKND